MTASVKKINRKMNVYTDGSCLGNPGKGGWAFMCVETCKLGRGNVKDKTTNNKMELTACIKALKYISSLDEPKVEINLFTDSNYTKLGIYGKDGTDAWILKWKQNGWKTSSKKQVVNVDLWQKLDKYNQELKIKWNWVKAHNGNKYNEIVDKVAFEEASKVGQFD
jgi:ribonuclease HI